MGDPANDQIVTLPAGGVELWEQVFTVAPLVLVGTIEEDGAADLAPKHQATPLGWASHYGFVCTARHRTHANVLRTGEFTVSFPTPDQSVMVGQAAAPRIDGEKLSLTSVPVRPATTVDGVLVEGSALWLECQLDRVVEGFGEHDLIAGTIVAASAPEWALRDPDVDDADLIGRHPSLAYLCPSRFAPITDSLSFPFPAAFRR
jgi:flavin reductase (DIM6/NTAB) family NADH-FMN oxidoreductase RutF